MGVGAESTSSAIWTSSQQRVARVLLTAAGYAVAGYPAHFLALPPGYASPIWPAAGVALVGAIVWRREALVGILLGSFLVNLAIGLSDAGGTVPLSMLKAALLGAGATAQAALGAWLARRALGPGNPVESGQSVILLLALGGPLASLLNAIWAPSWLVVLGSVPSGDYLANVFTWWVGDSIGVLVVAPLMLALHAPPYERRLGRWMSLAVPLAVCMAGVVALFFETERAAEQKQRFAFETHGRAVALGITSSVDRAAAYTESLARALGVLPTIDRSAFRTLVEPWMSTNPAVDTLHWLPSVPTSELPAFEAAQRDRAFPDFRVRLHPSGSPVRAPFPTDLHAPILFAEPLEHERNLIGYDAAATPELRRALERARDSGEVVATPPIHLEGDPDGPEILAIAASYGGIRAPETLEARRAGVRGFVAASMHVDEIVEDALVRTDGRPLGVRVTDLSSSPANLLSGPAELPFDAPVFTTYQGVGGRTWRLDVFRTGEPERSWAGWGVLAAGLGCTGLVVAFILDAGARAMRVERLVAERTAALGRVNEALTRSNLELQRFTYVASHDMREPLRTIACFTELLDRDEAAGLGDAGRGYLRRILGATRRMQGLVTEVLAFARVEGRVEAFRGVHLEEPVRAAVDDLMATILQTGATITIGTLPEVSCDRIQMVQLFQNLFSNAMKFRRPGVPPRIEVTGACTPGGCEIAVRDNGIGIERRHWSQIFEIFHKLHPDGRYPGQGIGLATCRRIVERHGGRIWVESEPGQGSVFRFTLRDEAAR